MTDPEEHLDRAVTLMSELGGIGYATNSEAERQRAMTTNCLSAIEEALAAGIANEGRTVPEDRAEKVTEWLDLYDPKKIPPELPDDVEGELLYEPAGPIGDDLQRWASFELSQDEPPDIGELLNSVDAIIGGVFWLMIQDGAGAES